MSNEGGIKRHIPNILTLLNLCCGFLSIYFISLGEWSTVCWLIGIAGLADLLDGLVARALNVSSPIGAQLDSLADMISFGVVPGMILFTAMIYYGVVDDNTSLSTPIRSISFGIPALIFPACAALRLARFNTEDDSSGDFRGLSTPAATATVIGFVILFFSANHSVGWTSYPPLTPPSTFGWEIYPLGIILSLFMVSNITMFSLKFNGTSWKGNELRYIFIVLFILLIFIRPKEAILATMLLYILTNTFLHLYRKLTA